MRTELVGRVTHGSARINSDFVREGIAWTKINLQIGPGSTTLFITLENESLEKFLKESSVANQDMTPPIMITDSNYNLRCDLDFTAHWCNIIESLQRMVETCKLIRDCRHQKELGLISNEFTERTINALCRSVQNEKYLNAR